jgi:hypothetical protein
VGWTLNGARFEFQGKATKVCADGNNVAWCCPCGAPILFVYQSGRKGSCASVPRKCEECLSEYWLQPGYDDIGEPPRSRKVNPSETMTIVRRSPGPDDVHPKDYLKGLNRKDVQPDEQA